MEKYNYYFNALVDVLRKMKDNPENRNYIKQNVLYSVKFINSLELPKGRDALQNLFDYISATKGIISLLTPNEFMNIFPISKVYDGDRYEIKDYYYTMDYINSMDKDKPIGDKTLEFLTEYINDDIDEFNLKLIMCVSHLRQHDGHLSLAEEFLAAVGHDTPNTFKNTKGEVMYVRHGKPEKIQRTKVNKLELIK